MAAGNGQLGERSLEEIAEEERGNFFRLCRIVLDNIPEVLRSQYRNNVLPCKTKGKQFENKKDLKQEINEWDTSKLATDILYSYCKFVRDFHHKATISDGKKMNENIAVVSLVCKPDAPKFEKKKTILIDLHSEKNKRAEVADFVSNIISLKDPIYVKSIPQEVTVYQCNKAWHAVCQLKDIRNEFAHAKSAQIDSKKFDEMVNNVKECYHDLTVSEESLNEILSEKYNNDEFCKKLVIWINKLKTMEGEADELKLTVTLLEEEQAALKNQVNDHERRIEGVEAQVEDNKSRNESLAAQVEDNKSRNESLAAQVEDNKSRNESLAANVDDHDSRLKKLEGNQIPVGLELPCLHNLHFTDYSTDQLRNVINDWEEQFGLLKRAVIMFFKENKLNVEEFKDKILCGLTQPLMGLKRWIENSSTENAKSFIESFDFIWSFMDYELLRFIIDRLENNVLIGKMNQYKLKVTNFLDTITIEQYVKCVEPRILEKDVEDLTPFVSGFKWNPKTTKMSAIKDISKKIALIFPQEQVAVAVTAYQLVCSSVIVIWMLWTDSPDMLMEFARQFISKNPQFISDNNIFTIILDNNILFSAPGIEASYLATFQDITPVTEQMVPCVQNYLEAYHHFINTKKSLDLLFVKFLFLGPPTLGKTTVIRRLLNEITNLIFAGEANKCHPSTGAVQSRNVIVKGTALTSNWSVLGSLADEAQIFIQSLMDSFNNTEVSSEPSQVDDFIRLNQSGETCSMSSESSHILPQPTGESNTQLHSETTSTSYYTSKKKFQLPYIFDSAMAKEASRSIHLSRGNDKIKAYLRLVDIGGHPELIDMLPALTLGPGLYLLFINLQSDLNHSYKLTYCNASEEKSISIESGYSVKDMILSSLSSISCLNACSHVDKPIPNSDLESIEKSLTSIAYIIGTHKDQVSNDCIKKLNENMKEVIKHPEFYKKDVVQFASKDEPIIALDNMNGGTEEVDKLKGILEKAMEKHFKKQRIPAIWLLFSLFLRNDCKKTVSLDYCMKLSSTLGMSARETEVALWFLHHHAGVLMYFPSVPELKNLVIIDVQVVYDSVTVLILQAMSFEKVGHSIAKEFKKTGKFTKSHIIAVTREVCGDHISIDKLVALLVFLHIIAPLNALLPSLRQKEVTYLMPCVLRNATIEELRFMAKITHNEILPLLFNFKSVPIGLFSALIAFLISSTKFELIEDEIYKNAFKFNLKSNHTQIILICRSSYFECIVSKLPADKELFKEVCFLIREEIESGLSIVGSHMNYGYLTYKLAFNCPIHHPCHLFEVDTRTTIYPISCTKETYYSQLKINYRATIWYLEGQAEITYPRVLQFKGLYTIKASALGTHLKVPEICLDQINKDNGGDNTEEVLDILKYWLHSDQNPSWKKLYEAVKRCDHESLAEKIKKKYIYST